MKTLIKIKNKRDAQDLANDLLSPTEKIMLAKRLAIAFLLIKNYQYREISKLLRVSLTTVGSVSLSLKFRGEGYERLLGRIASEEKLEDFFENIAEKLLTPGTFQRKGVAWRYLQKEIRNQHQRKSRSF